MCNGFATSRRLFCSMSPWLLHSSCPSLAGDHIDAPFSDEHSALIYSWHSGQLWVSVLTITPCDQLRLSLSVALIYRHKTPIFRRQSDTMTSKAIICRFPLQQGLWPPNHKLMTSFIEPVVSSLRWSGCHRAAGYLHNRHTAVAPYCTACLAGQCCAAVFTVG